MAMSTQLPTHQQNNLKCDECGEYIAYQDILKGQACRILTTPDSFWTNEEYETLCRKHYEKM